MLEQVHTMVTFPRSCLGSWPRENAESFFVWERHECRELFGVYATHNGLEAPGDCCINAWIDRRCQSRGIDVAYQTRS